MNRLKYDWEDIGMAIDSVVRQVKSSKLKFDGVYGVPRGGVVLALALSHALNIPMLMKSTKNSLVCDDISDTGITLSTLKHKKIACIFETPWTKMEPDYCYYVKADKKSWIIFPWEVDG